MLRPWFGFLLLFCKIYFAVWKKQRDKKIKKLLDKCGHARKNVMHATTKTWCLLKCTDCKCRLQHAQCTCILFVAFLRIAPHLCSNKSNRIAIIYRLLLHDLFIHVHHVYACVWLVCGYSKNRLSVYYIVYYSISRH